MDRICGAVGGIFLAVMLASPARADITVTLGNIPQPGEVNLVFVDQGPSTTLLGSISPGTSNLALTGTALGGSMLTSSSGTVTGSGSNITSLTFTPDGLINLLIFDALNGSGSLTFSVLEGDDQVTTVSNIFIGNGSNFYTIVASNGQTIQNVTVTDVGGSFASASQFHSSAILPSGVPEPGTWAMMLLGFSGIGLQLHSRRSRSVSCLPRIA
jgi:hypothetical protein